MKDVKKYLNDMISKFGVHKTAKMTGISTLNLIRKTDSHIISSVANEILEDLFKEKIFPRKYENCYIDYNSFSGTVNWICEWGNETTYTLATPFWDSGDYIPVDTESYTIKKPDGTEKEFTASDLENNGYTSIEWYIGFQNLASYGQWIRRFYLPKVYETIVQHLDDYRFISS